MSASFLNTLCETVFTFVNSFVVYSWHGLESAGIEQSDHGSMKFRKLTVFGKDVLVANHSIRTK